jgi:hypothetical protein
LGDSVSAFMPEKEGSQLKSSQYAGEKQRVADKIIHVFEARSPGSREKIEIIDVAIPATVLRYTTIRQGSMEGRLITPQTPAKQLPCAIPGIRNF